jgi:hypothetical protein
MALTTTSTVNSRFLDDVRDEPRMLKPLEGYEFYPLMSIEEATVPLYPIVDDLERKAWFAKKNSQEPRRDGLTPDESAAINLYTMEWTPTSSSLYAVLNRTLRLEDRDQLKPWFPYLKLFLTALYKIPSKVDRVWRGVKGVDLSTAYPTGQKCTWWALTSCTTSIEVLTSPIYLGDLGVRTLFSIDCKNGKTIGSHSIFQHESEVLLLPAIHLEVLGQLPAGGGLHIIHMKEIDPPYPIRAPPQFWVPNLVNPHGRVYWSSSDISEQRVARPGICLEGKCCNIECKAFDSNVIVPIGLNQKINIVCDINENNSKCPLCNQYIEPILFGFNNCYWRWSGIKQEQNGQAPIVYSLTEWKRADNAYHYFEPDSTANVIWRQLIIETNEKKY